MRTTLRVAAIVVLFVFVMGLRTAAAATTCTVTTSGVAFGNYDPPANLADLTSGTIIVTCDGNPNATVSYTIALNTGSGTFLNRRMTSGGNSLGYNLYVDATMLTIWGDGTGGTSVVADSYTFPSPRNPVTRSYTVHGRIPNNQTAARVGSYSDNVTVTLTFQ